MIWMFFDMDGTLTEYRLGATIADYQGPEHFEKLRPNEGVVQFAKKHAKHAYVATKVHDVPRKEEILAAKNRWLDQYLPEIPRERRLFIPYTESKAAFVEDYLGEPLTNRHWLYDDNSTILNQEWAAHGGFGIKVDNGINCHGNKWQGHIVSMNHPAKLERRTNYGK